MSSAMSYFCGILVGLCVGLITLWSILASSADSWSTVLLAPPVLMPLLHWLDSNLGGSLWLFALVLLFFIGNLMQLKSLLAEQVDNHTSEEPDQIFKRIMQIDQLSDVWIHLFIGIGVIWTAIGMRSSLETTLGVPNALTEGAGEVLARLVDGGILMALTTTIVGAFGGYLMQLTKTISLGAELNHYYHTEQSRKETKALDSLQRIEVALNRSETQPHAVNQTRPFN